jgi:hypothetical protein
MVEGYFSVHNFSKRENITFALLKELPHMSNIGGKLTGRKLPQRNLEYMGPSPLGNLFWMWPRNNTTMLITMNNST